MRILQATFVFTLLITLLAVVSCRESTDPPPAPAPKSAIGSAPFTFDYKTCDRLEIAKNDPISGDRWAARVESRSGSWWIEGSDAAVPMTDKLANGPWVGHLLDGVTAVRIIAPGSTGTDATMGLVNPWFTLQGRCDGKLWSLKLGAMGPNGRYARVGDGPAFQVRGSALALLAQAEGASKLRFPWVLPHTADALFTFEVLEGNRSLFYAERLNGGWANAKRKPLKSEAIDGWLELLTHIPVQTPVEPAEKAARTYEKLSKTAKYRIRIRDLQDREWSLWASPDGSGALSATSLRPGAAFGIRSKDLALFSKPGQTQGN